VKGQIAIIILDEIDKMLIKNRNEVYSLIYKFTRDPNICLIGITNKYDIPRLMHDFLSHVSQAYKRTLNWPYSFREIITVQTISTQGRCGIILEDKRILTAQLICWHIDPFAFRLLNILRTLLCYFGGRLPNIAVAMTTKIKA